MHSSSRPSDPSSTSHPASSTSSTALPSSDATTLQPHPTPSPSPHSTSTPDFDRNLSHFLTSEDSAYELRSIQALTQAYYAYLYRSQAPPLCEFLKKAREGEYGAAGAGEEARAEVREERDDDKFRAKRVVRGFAVRERR